VVSDACLPLTSLLRWQSELGALVDAANSCDQQDGPSVLLDREAVKTVLQRCIAGKVEVAELPIWAGAVHMLERVEIEEDDLDLLAQFLFEVSTPELFEPMTVDLCQAWISRMVQS
jgi:hypothetical protein